MNKENTYTTKKGSVLPLMKLKGKDYMMVAHRIVWLVDEVPIYTTNVEFLSLTDEKCVAKVILTIFDENGKQLKRVEDCKCETAKSFPDFIEKAITGALGRCLGQAGYGTAYALQDLDEGERLADAPLDSETIKETKKTTPAKRLAKEVEKEVVNKETGEVTQDLSEEENSEVVEEKQPAEPPKSNSVFQRRRPIRRG